MDYTYTLDKLVSVMRVRTSTISKILNALRYGSGSIYGEIGKDWVAHGISSYHENVTVNLPNGVSFYFSTRPNKDAPSEYWETCKLEFNPAKVGDSEVFTNFYTTLLGSCKWIDFKRFDVAIDIPVAREDMMLLSDARKRMTIEYSASNKTTYLGLRTAHGNVKLYNKQLESDLDTPLTRLEITMEYEKSSYEEFKRVFPRVVAVQLDGLKDTDAVICLACLEHEEYLRRLGRGKRKKIETLLAKASLELKPDEILYKQILSQILWYGKGIPIELHEFSELEDDIDMPFPPSFGEVRGEQEEL